MERLTGSQVRFAFKVVCLEITIVLAVMFLPAQPREAMSVLCAPFLVPGAFAAYLLGGGMCLVEGCSPGIVVALAVLAGFVANTTLLGLAVYWIVRSYRMFTTLISTQSRRRTKYP